MYTVYLDGPSGENYTTVDPTTATPVENLPANTVQSLAGKESLPNKNVAGGYPGLDDDGKIAASQIPDIAGIPEDIQDHQGQL